MLKNPLSREDRKALGIITSKLSNIQTELWELFGNSPDVAIESLFLLKLWRSVDHAFADATVLEQADYEAQDYAANPQAYADWYEDTVQLSDWEQTPRYE